jgi:hypothetical protein
MQRQIILLWRRQLKVPSGCPMAACGYFASATNTPAQSGGGALAL